MNITLKHIKTVLYSFISLAAIIGIISIVKNASSHPSNLEMVNSGNHSGLTSVVLSSVVSDGKNKRVAALERDGHPKKIPLPIPQPITAYEESLEEKMPTESFRELNESRIQRTLLIDYLIREQKIRESPRGTLDFLAELNEIANNAVIEENLTRMKLFTLIARKENRGVIAVGREFYHQRTGKGDEAPANDAEIPDIPVSLSIDTPRSMGNTVGPRLAEAFLKSLGYDGVKSSTDGTVTRISGRRSFENRYVAVEVRTHRSASSGDVADRGVMIGMKPTENSGVPGTVALEGIAVVVHPENPISWLTVAQVGDIFSGSIREWSQLRGGNEGLFSLFALNDDSGTIEKLQEIVLEPSGEKLWANINMDYRESSELLEHIASNPSAIGFVTLADLTGGVKAIKIKASRDARGITPSRINVKAFDYALSRVISIVPPMAADDYAREFVAFALSEEGQAIFDEEGFIGLAGPPSHADLEARGRHRQDLLDDPGVPSPYKNLIRDADRMNSAANCRFTEGTQLTADSEQSLRRLAEFLVKPGNETLETILIGFTDSSGGSSANRSYSRTRAESVADRLRSKGVSRITTAGFGEEMPVADNSTTAGRIANRRVEVWIRR